MTKAVFIWVLLIITLSACKGNGKDQLPKGVVEGRGQETGEVQKRDAESSSHVVSSAPEIVSVKLFPSSPTVNDSVKAEVLTSKEASVNYQWSINNRQVEVSENILPPGEFKRGDKISLTIIPSWGKQKGKPVTVFTNIFNSLPKVIPDLKTSKYKDGDFTCQITATDPDGDQLAYSLKSGPTGMTVDPSTGLIKWKVPQDFSGKAPFTVSVADGHGGEASQNVSIDISPQQK